MTRTDDRRRLYEWLEEDASPDACRELLIERGVSSRPDEKVTVFLHDTAAWFRAHEAWEAAGEVDPEPNERTFSAWGCGLTLDEAIAACVADLNRPGWGIT